MATTLEGQLHQERKEMVEFGGALRLVESVGDAQNEDVQEKNGGNLIC